jgi:hypothetical protein
MTRLVCRKNRGMRVRVLASVVLCALLIALAIVANIDPYLPMRLLGMGYTLSVYVAIIFCLSGAIFALMPTVKARLAALRLQVSDDGPLLGPKAVSIEEDGLVFDRPLIRSKYLWGALQGVEISNHALVLPIDNGIGLIIPASAFSTDAARYAFVAELHKRLESARVSRNAGVP